MFEKISLSSRSRDEFIDITDSVRQAVRKSAVREGLCLVYVPHTTAAVTINENADPSVPVDILGILSRIAPRNDPKYRHSEGNADSHVKSSVVGCSRLIPVADSDLVLGTWQAIFFCEFDGPRRRSVFVQVIPGKA